MSLQQRILTVILNSLVIIGSGFLIYLSFVDRNSCFLIVVLILGITLFIGGHQPDAVSDALTGYKCEEIKVK